MKKPPASGSGVVGGKGAAAAADSGSSIQYMPILRKIFTRGNIVVCPKLKSFDDWRQLPYFLK